VSARLGRGAVVALTARECGHIALCRRAILDQWQRVGGVPDGLLDLLDELAEAAREERVRVESRRVPRGGSAGVPALADGTGEPLYLSTFEAAERLGVTTRRVRELVAKGRLCGRHLDGRSAWAITVESVEARESERAAGRGAA